MATVIAFLSGFATLALEVLWTRMFSQVLNNSVYSFAAILITFLLALALGSVLAHRLNRIRWPSDSLLSLLLLACGFLVAFSPLVFGAVTHGLNYIETGNGWAGYVLSIFIDTALVILVPGIVVGSIFPFLLRLRQGQSASAGRTIGRLAAVNTIGAILGSVGAGFVLLNMVGLWGSLKLIAGLYFLMGTLAMRKFSFRALFPLRLPAAALGAVLLLAVPNLSLVRIDPRKEKLIEVWEGSHGTVAVVNQGVNLNIRVDNYYRLASGSAFYEPERWMARIPLLLHPDAKSVFFIGMGTGATAGAALDHPIRKVVVAELIPEVVTAAEKYFSSYNNGLFRDPRAKVVTEDGRNYLLGTPDTYDVIVSDIFTPWHAGIGSLYSLEHFATIRSRLNPGGLFALWLTGYQISQEEFAIIARTMNEVFPQVTLWREHFRPDIPILALIGCNGDEPLDPARIRKKMAGIVKSGNSFSEAIPEVFYVGNITAEKELFERSAVNTDNRPVIEYLAPVIEQKQRSGQAVWLTYQPLENLFDTLFDRLPPERDPFLRNLSSEQVGKIRAGLDLYKAFTYYYLKDYDKARDFYRKFKARIPAEMMPDLESPETTSGSSSSPPPSRS